MRGIYKVPFHQDETATSFAARLAAANGLSPTPFCEDMGFSFDEVIRGRQDALLRLSEVSHVPHERLAHNAFLHRPNGHGILRGEEVRTPWIARFHARVCPLCLDNDVQREEGPKAARRYYRIHWQLTSIRCCPIHNAPLFELPRVTSYRSFDLDYRIGVSTRELHKALRSRDTTPFTEFEQFVLDRLEGRKQAGPLLDKMTMMAAADTCELFGMYTEFGKYVNLKKASEDEWRLAAQSGYKLLLQGREGIRQFGRHMAAQENPKRCAYGGYHILGGINLALSPGQRKGRDYDLVRDELINVVRETVAIAGKCNILGQTLSKGHVAIHHAFKKLGGSQPHVRALLLHFAEETDNEATVFASSVIDKASEYLDDLATPTEAMSFLGINRAALEHLINRNAVFNDPLFAKLFPDSWPRYSRAAMQSLIDTARSASPVPSGAGMYSISKAAQKARVPYPDIVELLLKKKLLRVHYDPKLPGLGSILVDPPEIASHFRIGEEWMLTDEVASLLKVEIESVQLLARECILTGHKLGLLGYASTTKFFDRDEVNAFHERYASSMALSEESNLTGAKVAQLLRDADIDKVRAKFLVFYERRSAMRALAHRSAA